MRHVENRGLDVLVGQHRPFGDAGGSTGIQHGCGIMPVSIHGLEIGCPFLGKSRVGDLSIITHNQLQTCPLPELTRILQSLISGVQDLRITVGDGSGKLIFGQ